MRIVLPPNYGGIGRSLVVRALNDTGSSIMTLFYEEAFTMGWLPALFPAQQIPIRSADTVTLRDSIFVFAQVCDYNGSPVTDWFVEQVVLRHFTGVEARSSSSEIRNQLYISTIPRLQNLYIARSKNRLSQILPSLDQLPPS
jgi:hypothetical protein